MKLEYKNIAVSVIDADEAKGVVTGYFSIFGNVDDGQDIVMPGAFKKTISENGHSGKNRIIHLFNHDPDKIMGKPYLLKEDNVGLYFETKFTKTQLGKDVLQWYIDGVIDEHSMGYESIKSMFPDEVNKPMLRELHEVKLWEGSTVTWGMNELAKAVSVKGSNNIEKFEYVLKRMNNLETALKNPKYTDEGYYQLTLQVEQLKTSLEQLKTDLTPDIEKTEKDKIIITEQKTWLSYFDANRLRL